MSKHAPPRSVWSRSSRLVALAAGLAKDEVKSRLSRALERGEALAQQAEQLRVQMDQARAIVESLGQLKGAAMKAGQLLSMELRDVLPPEVITILSQLQASGATVAFEEIESILREELGVERLSQLDVDRTPLASASIGQVHRATWRSPDGQTHAIVLKVQFRGIADSIDSDLALLERIARLFLTVQLKQFDVTAVFAELKDVLIRETDYAHEADALERYRERAHGVPGLRVPSVFRALCTSRVLALSYEDGLTLDAFLATQPSIEEREQFAHRILDLYFREFFDWGLVQTDANFANFLFRPKTGELVLLDFGATREYPEHFRIRYRALLTASIAGDREKALEAAYALTLIDPKEPPSSRDALHALLDAVLVVFTPRAQPVDFQDKAFVDEAGTRLKAYYRSLTCSPPPAQLLFLHRKLGGVYSMGRALRARLDLLPYRARLETAFAG
jgi:aarF domain-containing kinase